MQKFMLSWRHRSWGHDSRTGVAQEVRRETAVIRKAIIGLVCVLGLVGVSAANAAVPVPKPKPTQDTANAQAAIAALVNSLEAQATTPELAYAPSGTAADPSPTRSSEVSMYLVGKLSPEGEPIGSGLVWRVYRDFPNEDGQLPMVHKATGGDLEMRLKPGRYIVHASYGRASVSRSMNLNQAVNTETFVLNAGGLMLQAVMDGADEALADDTVFELYMIERENRRMVGTIEPGAIARLPAGAYHVVSRYGTVNAIRSADVEVVAGKLTQVALRHRAGTVRLKLVRSEGGEAIADTTWTVYNDNGDPIFNRVGAHANVTLAAGEYAVVARHRDAEFSRSFVVQSGAQKDVVVLARRL